MPAEGQNERSNIYEGLDPEDTPGKELLENIVEGLTPFDMQSSENYDVNDPEEVARLAQEVHTTVEEEEYQDRGVAADVFNCAVSRAEERSPDPEVTGEDLVWAYFTTSNPVRLEPESYSADDLLGASGNDEF